MSSYGVISEQVEEYHLDSSVCSMGRAWFGRRFILSVASTRTRASHNSYSRPHTNTKPTRMHIIVIFHTHVTAIKQTYLNYA